MNIIEIIAVVLIVLVIIFTFISEPKLSFNYYKACFASVGKLFNIIKDKIVDWRGGSVNDGKES